MTDRHTPASVLALVQRGEPDACWPWGGYVHDGYGRVNFEGKVWRAHRLVLALVTGTTGPVARHSCDNPVCCNYERHLAWGTVGDNVRDAVARGQHSNGRARRTHCVRGHLLDRANTRTRPNGSRCCRTCERDRTRAYRRTA